MFTRIVHSIVAQPKVYDLVQFVVGASAMRRRMAARVAALGKLERVADVGGGTGAGRSVVPPGCRYLCMDIDPAAIGRFVEKNPGDWAVVADAARMPLPDRSLDAVICMFVAHHLTDELFERFVEEAARVLKPTGSLIFAEPLWAPRRWPG